MMVIILNYLNREKQKVSLYFTITIIIFYFFSNEKLFSQNINVEPEFLIGQALIKKDGYKFSGTLFETGLNLNFYSNTNESFTWNLGTSLKIGQLNFDDIQSTNFKRFTVDYLRIPLFLNLQQNGANKNKSDNSLFSLLMTIGVYYKAINNSEFFNGEMLLEGNKANTFGLLGKFGIKIHISNKLYTLISINAASDFSELNLSNESKYRILNERFFGFAVGINL